MSLCGWQLHGWWQQCPCVGGSRGFQIITSKKIRMYWFGCHSPRMVNFKNHMGVHWIFGPTCVFSCIFVCFLLTIFHCKIFSRFVIIVGLLLVDCNITTNYTILEKVRPFGVVLSIKVLMGENLGYIRVLANGWHVINNN